MADRREVAIRSPRIRRELEARRRWDEGLVDVVERDLARYYRLLAEALRSVSLRANEALLINLGLAALKHDKLRGFSGRDRGGLVSIAAEAAVGPQGHLHRVDVDDLTARLAALSPAQVIAVLDALEQMDIRIYHPDRPRAADVLREIGLVRDEA